METRNIIVIGASSDGFEALKRLVADLPKDFDASLFIVWHISPNVEGFLPHVLNKAGSIPAANAVDKEPIKTNRIYVAPPDRHLLVERGRVRVTRGPKENRFRPAVDPLFRSAAYAYCSRVIGIVLTGALDDGTSGLWAVKHHGGVAIVQDPVEAEYPSMPLNAMSEVKVDYCVPLSEMAELIVRLSREKVKTSEVVIKEDKLTEVEIHIAKEASAFESGIMKFGELSPYTCPECHGVLMSLKGSNHERFRCHTGHAFSADSLLANITESIEDSLWSVIRNIGESIMLLNQMGNHLANTNQVNLAALYFKKAFEAEERVNILRKAVVRHEHLSNEKRKTAKSKTT